MNDKLSLRWARRSFSGATLASVLKSLLNKEEVFRVTKSAAREAVVWLKYLGVIDKNKSLTELGKIILKYDPYFEEPLTLLIFQNNLVKQETLFKYFFKFPSNEIERDYFISQFWNENMIYSPEAISDAFTLIINTYVQKRHLPEDPGSVLSPLRLVRKSHDKKVFYKYPANLKDFNSWLTLAFITEIEGELSLSKIAEKFWCSFNFDTLDTLNLLWACRQVELKVITGLAYEIRIPENISFLECIENSYKALNRKD